MGMATGCQGAIQGKRNNKLRPGNGRPVSAMALYIASKWESQRKECGAIQ